MEKARKHMFIFRMVCVILAIVTALPLCIAGCNKNKHVCESKCPTCGYCLNKDCKEEACKLKCPGHKEEKATIKSVDVTFSPKTEYYPGEVFDITGLAVKANLSNGKTKKFFYNDFTQWTHKDEALDKTVDKITFTVPGYDFTFDVSIKVGIPEGMTLLVDTIALKDEYSTDEKIDFSLLKVKTSKDGKVELLKAEDWKLYNGAAKFSDITAVSAADLGVGEVTLTVEHVSGLKTNFTVKIIDSKKVITPAVIDAEDNVFMLENGVETGTAYKKVESNTIAEYYEDGSKVQTARLYNGFSGRGMVTNLDVNYSKVYFKFKVNVPEAGQYDLNLRAQYINSNKNIKDMFSVNINGAKDASGNYVFTKNSIAQTVNCGNQLKNYCTLPAGQTGYMGYYNMFWWSSCKLGTFELNKGDNEIRVYMNSKVEANIDCFEVTYVGEGTANASIFSMRTKGKQSLNGKVLYLNKGERLTDIVKTPANHPVKYTLLYLRTSSGKEIPVLESMLDGKIDYEKIGEAQLIEVTDPVSKESASFTLVIEEVKE